MMTIETITFNVLRVIGILIFLCAGTIAFIILLRSWSSSLKFPESKSTSSLDDATITGRKRSGGYKSIESPMTILKCENGTIVQTTICSNCNGYQLWTYPGEFGWSLRIVPASLRLGVKLATHVCKCGLGIFDKVRLFFY